MTPYESLRIMRACVARQVSTGSFPQCVGELWSDGTGTLGIVKYQSRLTNKIFPRRM